jgi:YD repeat-containing protein
MNILKLALSIVLIVLLASCKKEDAQQALPRLKSVTTTNSNQQLQTKTEFDYNADGHLIKTRQSEGNELQTYVDYSYEGGVLKYAKSFVKKGDGLVELMAETNFTYHQDKLVRVLIEQNPGIPENASSLEYKITYNNSDLPIVTVSSTEELSANPGLIMESTGLPISNYYGEGGISEIPTVTLVEEFDNKLNPYRGLPLISSGKLVSMAPMPVPITTYIHLFNVSSFFQPHNLVRRSVGSETFIKYTYNKYGLPLESLATNNRNNFAVKTIYEYW